jgi:hypothetical protein
MHWLIVQSIRSCRPCGVRARAGLRARTRGRRRPDGRSDVRRVKALRIPAGAQGVEGPGADRVPEIVRAQPPEALAETDVG